MRADDSALSDRAARDARRTFPGSCILALLLTAAGCRRPAEICAPWSDLGLPAPRKVNECSASRLDVQYPYETSAHDDKLFDQIRALIEQHGFHRVTTNVKEDATKVVVRRDQDGRQLELFVVGSQVQILVNHDVVLRTTPADVAAQVDAFRKALAASLRSFPAKVADTHPCDDAELQRIDPAIAEHPVRFVDVDTLQTPPSSKAGSFAVPLLVGAPYVPAPNARADDLAFVVDKMLPELQAQKIVVGYRVKELKLPEVVGEATTEVDAKGRRKAKADFQSGLFLADLVVFDRERSRALCWAPVMASSGGAVSTYGGARQALEEDLRRSVGSAVEARIHQLSRVLKFKSVVD